MRFTKVFAGAAALGCTSAVKIDTASALEATDRWWSSKPEPIYQPDPWAPIGAKMWMIDSDNTFGFNGVFEQVCKH